MKVSVDPEVLLAAGYSLLLVLVAVGLEWLGRYSHWRSGRFRTAGFRYHAGPDVWECPCGHHLHRHYADPVRRATRYRAPAQVCNACARKGDCTDSERGREIAVSSASWMASEAWRFHRGISLLLLLLATVILAVVMFRCQSAAEFCLSGSLLAGIMTLKWRLWRRFCTARSVEESGRHGNHTPWKPGIGEAWPEAE